ncbi:MAG: DNA polymerase III subunit alpha [Flavobacteriales bacterium]|jgi:DNA polymerase-3 subunit alpha|nr:DNA polymerase III subunit alpha [Flavobacteriales bacterium]
MYLIFDTETTGLPKDFNAPITNTENWPRLVQIAWQIHDKEGKLVDVQNFIVKPEGFTIPFNAEKIHGISTERAQRQGMSLEYVLEEFNKAVSTSEFIIGHNIVFDNNIMGCEYYRKSHDTELLERKTIDTKNVSVDYCAIPGGKGGKFKWPTLTELHTKLFQEGFNEAHNASADVEATARCFLELLRLGVVSAEMAHLTEEEFQNFQELNPNPFELIGLNIQPYAPDDLETDEETKPEEETELKDIDLDANRVLLAEAEFTHLHTHTQFSVLQSTTQVGDLVAYASKNKQRAIAMTDRGNLMAAFNFVGAITKENAAIKKKIKEAEEAGETYFQPELTPIIGSEFNVCKNHLDKSFKDNGISVSLYAKNANGFTNLSKLSSYSQVNGFYYVPRVDKELILEYKEDLMVLTGGLYGFLYQMILNEGVENAEKELLWWKEQFGDDLYVEINRHGLDEENVANKIIQDLAKKHQLKLLATNDTFYTYKQQHNAHDILLCIKDGNYQSTPIGKGRNFRYGLESKEYYMKSPEEMKELFVDIPEAILNIQEFIDKCSFYKLKRDILLPNFDIPEEFIAPEDEEDGGKRGENAFLRHLTYEGAKERYGEITEEIAERLDFELATIENTGYPGYFLIVQDFTREARNMGVSVGPGRGSAAGSAVAYCIGITNVDPIRYDLLFERFLNPDRVSMPDIDIDFDDEGRDRIIQWVIDKYGASQVAQIITYGSLAAKSAFRDTARVLEYPLVETNEYAKLIPDGAKLKKIAKMDEKTLEDKFKGDDFVNVKRLLELKDTPSKISDVLKQAEIVEGSLRNTGVHACGVIITPDDITNFVPVTRGKMENIYLTQYDNAVVESAGLLKMDFLGLKTLTIIKEACRIIKLRHGIEIDPDKIPLDDKVTYELYQRGETNGTFQFESEGMQQHLRSLKPTRFEDLIAMNALYRPGPMEYIPEFVKRKHGLSEITYDLEGMEEYLEETYGITVYQEQVMLLSQKLAGFSKGDADTLRKAMGKKVFALLEQLRPKFLEGGQERGHDKETLLKVWNDWEAFAAYAFNKSHATCYSYVAYHTGYLKANYPAEFMAAVLTHNSNNIKKVTFLMEECKRMGMKVLSPDINESIDTFMVNEQGEIRFGMSAIKGVGEAAVKAIVEERNNGGNFQEIFDFVKRIDLRAVNKKTIENLVLAGAFDSFKETHRGTFFHEVNIKGDTYLNEIVRFGQKYKEHLNRPPDLFGNSEEFSISNPAIPQVELPNKIESLKREKEVVGIYISAHPLDIFKEEIAHTNTTRLADLDFDIEIDDKEIETDDPKEKEELMKAAVYERQKQIQKLSNQQKVIAGQVVEFQEKITRKGDPFGIFIMEDYSGSKKFLVFNQQYALLRPFLTVGAFVSFKIKFQPRRFNQDELEIHFMSGCYLSEVFEKQFHELNIIMRAGDVDETLISQIGSVCEQYPGTKRLFLNIFDSESKKTLKLLSQNTKVEINSEIIKELKDIEKLIVKVN